MPLIFLHCVLNTDVFSFLFGPEDDHLWLKHYIRHVPIYVDSTLLFFSFHQVSQISITA